MSDCCDYNEDFWNALDALVNTSEIVIDRPKGSAHPRFPGFIYRVDYGYLRDTSSMDGAGIDIGCGSGAFLTLVQEKYPEIQLNALDLSEEMAAETRERLLPTAIVTVGDSENMPLEDSQYQAVTCNMSIHHYPHPQKAVNEMYRILTDGGCLLLNDMDCAAPIRWCANRIFPHLPGGDVKMYNCAEILEMVKQAGFKEIIYRKISPFSFQCVAVK